MEKMENDLIITIKPFMVNDLKLTGNALIMYAMIYSFTVGSKGAFFGSKDYIIRNLGIGLTSAYRILKSLEAQGFVYRSGFKQDSKIPCFKVNLAFVKETEKKTKSKEPESRLYEAPRTGNFYSRGNTYHSGNSDNSGYSGGWKVFGRNGNY